MGEYVYEPVNTITTYYKYDIVSMWRILYINTLSWGPSHASVGYSLRPTRISSLSMDAVCLSHCYKSIV